MRVPARLAAAPSEATPATPAPCCRDPKAFLEGLLERYVREVQRSTPAANLGSPSKPGLALVAAPATASGGDILAAGAGAAAPGSSGGDSTDTALLLSAAAVALLQVQPALADHAVALGYVDKLVRLLAVRAPALPAGGLTPELFDAAPLLPGTWRCQGPPLHGSPWANCTHALGPAPCHAPVLSRPVPCPCR